MTTYWSKIAGKNPTRAGLTIWWALRSSQRWGLTGKRGGEGAEIETPKASSEEGNGEGVSPSPAD